MSIREQSRYRLRENVWLDAERALWIENARLLAVADIHLGYPWVHRAQGQLLPLTPDDTAQRLVALQQRYQPDTFVLVGDIVHGAPSRPEVLSALKEVLFALIDAGVELVVLGGNHDRGLSRLVERNAWPVQVETRFNCGDYLFLHGDSTPTGDSDRITVIGHEHPAIRLGDGVTGPMKYPCFLISDRIIVLPAFSNWAAGTPIADKPFLSAAARGARFTKAIAIVGGRLLPVDLAKRY